MKFLKLKSIFTILLLAIVFSFSTLTISFAATNSESEKINETPEIYNSTSSTSGPFSFCSTTLTPISESRLKINVNMNSLYTVDKIGYYINIQKKTLLWWSNVNSVNYSGSNISSILKTHYVSVDSNDDYRLKITYSINDNSETYYIYETSNDVYVK